jgi:methylated-DNA-protein-cysteine methyltransferase related protein
VTPFGRFRTIIARVPRGRVTTYGQVARAAGYPRAPRLTVWALRGAHGLPWHRIVAVGGRIALPGEAGVEQRLRLEMEGVRFRGERVRMDLHGWEPGGRTPARPRSSPRRTDASP